MLFKEFKVKGKHKDTHRCRTEHIYVKSESECVNEALKKGLTEPLEIEEIPPRKPTERQLEYAKSLKINISEDMSFYDVSALISRITDEDNSDPRSELIEYADSREMIFSKYIGKKALYNLIFSSLTGKDKVAFFLFCVYRWLSDDRYGNLDNHPHRDKFYSNADFLLSDESFIKSMEKYSGENIRYFGEIRTMSGKVYFGGSVNTIAYKKATEILCKEFRLKNRTVKNMTDSSLKKINDKNAKFHYKKSNGCLPSVILFLGIGTILFVLLTNLITNVFAN